LFPCHVFRAATPVIYKSLFLHPKLTRTDCRQPLPVSLSLFVCYNDRSIICTECWPTDLSQFLSTLVLLAITLASLPVCTASYSAHILDGSISLYAEGRMRNRWTDLWLFSFIHSFNYAHRFFAKCVAVQNEIQISAVDLKSALRSCTLRSLYAIASSCRYIWRDVPLC
jgi:hypothetical protein